MTAGQTLPQSPMRTASGARVLVERALLAIIFVALLFGVQILLTATINGSVVQIIVLAGVNVILAVSLTLINGITGQFSLGHAGFMAIGAFSGAYFTRDVAPKIGLGPDFAFVLALLLAGALAGLAGLIVGLPSLRLRGDYLAIVTLGFGQIIVSILRTLKFEGDSNFINSVPLRTNFVWTYALAALCILTVRNLADSALGRSMRAVREDEIAAEAAGIDTTQVKVLAFVISAAWAGVAGALYAHALGIAHPDDYRFVRSVEIVVMVVLGGLGSITGATITAVLLRFLEELLRDVNAAFIITLSLIVLAAALSWPRHREDVKRGGLDGLGVLRWIGWPLLSMAALLAAFLFARSWFIANVASLRYIIYALILIVLMLLRPQGLMGRAELSRNFFRRKNTPRGRDSALQAPDEGVSGTL